jgi:hypothetical protein
MHIKSNIQCLCGAALIVGSICGLTPLAAKADDAPIASGQQAKGLLTNYCGIYVGFGAME